MTGYDADPICDIPDTCHILPYHIRKRKKQYDCQCDSDEIFVRNFKSSLQHLTQHYIEVDVTVSECSNWPTHSLNNRMGATDLIGTTCFYRWIFLSFAKKGKRLLHSTMKKCKLFSTLAKLQAFNVNVNPPAYVVQHFVRHAKVYA